MIEALVTIVALVAGYLAATIVVLAATPKQENLPNRLAAAAIALFLLFVVSMASFVGSEYVMDQYPEFVIQATEATSGSPLWVRAWNKVAENMVSEVFQVLMAALYFKHRRWPGSPESK